ncbi:MAG: molybdopterin-dependent oxidoreductase [Planctomycetota bacterium]|jgi:DMSO/TMAO reductase YedYZ molybdopterin-dependent catalytic subunit
MKNVEQVAEEHTELTRRYFLKLGAAGAAMSGFGTLWAQDDDGQALLREAVSKLEFLTKEEDFQTYGRGNPKPHKLPKERLPEVGLTRDTWKLEVVADSESDSVVNRPMTIADGTALDFKGLMKLAETKAVRYINVVTCTNGKAPCGTGLWEGVPLRDVIWMAKPERNVRRVFYYGYHNNDPKQRFQSSLSIGRVLEDPPGMNPVILAYKMNGQWLTIGRGAPVRMVVPDQYANRAVKWLQRIVLTNSFKANDTYAEWNNDTVSYIKTCARFIHAPKKIKAGRNTAITGIAQVGMSGLSKVQYWLCPKGKTTGKDDPYFTKADWKDAEILPAPKDWGGGLKGGKLPDVPSQIDAGTGKPKQWPIHYATAHWATLLKVDKPGQYDLRCRTIDANGIAQPMPRPFLKAGKNDIAKVQITVES